LTYDGALEGTHRLGRRTMLTVVDTAYVSYTDEAPLLLDEGTILPRVLSRTNRAQIGLAFERWRRTGISVALRHEIWDFEREAFVGRSTLSGLVSARRQLTRGHGLGLSYLGQARWAAGRFAEGHRLSLGWDGALHASFRADAAVGIQELNRLDGGSHFEPYTSAGFQWGGDPSSLGVRYEHGVALSYTSTIEERRDTGIVSGRLRLTRRLSLGLSSTYSLRQDLDRSSTRRRLQRHAAGLGFDLGAGLALALNYSYRLQTEEGPDPRRDRHRLGVSVSYGHRWR
jgi:hypothetical protein